MKNIDFIDHTVVETRSYQADLYENSKDENTLVCLPTGLGKTVVSACITAKRLYDTGGTSLVVAPSKPLVNQHVETYRNFLTIPDGDIVAYTGDTRPDDRPELWNSSRVIIATPQVVKNDLINGRITLEHTSHITFDECHRATGDYPYVYIAKMYDKQADDPLITAMSASPGGNKDEIVSVCKNLFITNIEVKLGEDDDVSEYTHETDVTWKTVDMPDELLSASEKIEEVIRDRTTELRKMGFTQCETPNKKQLFGIKDKINQERESKSDNDDVWAAYSYYAELMNLLDLKKLVETQGTEQVVQYYERLEQKAKNGDTEASKRLVNDPKIKSAVESVQSFGDIHPKFAVTMGEIGECLGLNGGERVLIFTEYRDTVESLVEYLQGRVSVERFVGQSDTDGSDGMSQSEQQEAITRFKNGETEVLVSTSVAEEGLDIPEVDLVLFYEPVSTAIRTIQRRGRTGRQATGKVVILMAGGTNEENMYWITQSNKSTMEDDIKNLRDMGDELDELLGEQKQKTFDSYSDTASTTTDSSSVEEHENGDTDDDDSTPVEETNVDSDSFNGGENSLPTILVDDRETRSGVAESLSLNDDVDVSTETLSVGDYILSENIGVERKTTEDFLDTIVGERQLFEQMDDLANNYDRPIMILEGGTPFGRRSIHPNAIYGALSSLIADFGVSIMYTDDADGTAELMAALAKREQNESDSAPSSEHANKTSKTFPEQQVYIVSSFIGVGPVTAELLLSEFGTIDALTSASEEELQRVDGVGVETASKVVSLSQDEYSRD